MTTSCRADRSRWFSVRRGLVSKTTYLSNVIRSTALARGSENVLAASFTVTAAQELAGRNLPIPKNQLGTLHSLAYRSIDAPPVAEERLEEWNKAHPALALTVKPGAKTNLDDGAPVEASDDGATEGDALLSEMDIYRNRMIDRSLWKPAVRSFAEKWSEWKRAEGVIDFVDMIEIALADVAAAPGNPQVGFVDETQDLSAVELALVRKWGTRMERLVLAGDDDQAIYRFRGATPDAFLDPPVPEEDKKVLAQSFRVPASVHRVAEHWVARLSRREPKVYLPREEEGDVRHMPLQFAAPGELVAAAAEAAERGTVMILGSCSYMLDPIKHELRRQGLPFHNPYRRKRGDWNPLARRANQVSSADRLLAYLIIDERMFGEASRLWTGHDVRRWVHVLKTQGVFRRGAKTAVADLPDRELSYTEVASLFDDEVELEQCVTPSVEWFERHLQAGVRKGMEFPIAVVKKRGGAVLLEEPRIVLGTIHSTKGAQADTVLLLPDLSLRGALEWNSPGERQDSVVRQFYVGMTRAKRELVVCDASSPRAISVEQLIAGARQGAA